MQINTPLSPFEAQALQILTELKIKMDDLAGPATNKSTGRIPVLESKVAHLTIAVIALTLLTGAATYPHAIAILSWILK